MSEEEKKESKRIASKKWRDNNKEIIKLKNKDYNKKYYNDNLKVKKIKKEKLSEEEKKESKRIASKKWRDNNKDYQKNYVEENFDKISNYKKEYDNINKEKLNRDRVIRKKNRYITDLNYRVKTNIRSIILKSFKKSYYSKNSKTQEILGCTFEEFKLYLESKFDDWMTWENKGLYNGELNYGWDIDHIIPLSTAETEDDIIRLNHYKNLQPLCGYINRNIKKDKIDYEMG